MATDAAIGDLPGEGPWMVKAQVPVGGRGKAGGVVRCETPQDVAAAVQRMLGSRLKGHQVDACLIEQAAAGEERYLAIMVDAASYGLRVIYSAQGGVDIERSGSAQGRLCPPHAGAVAEALAELIAGEPEAWRGHIAAVGRRLADMLIERELALAEINPLFVSPRWLRRRRCEAGGGSRRRRTPAAHRRADRGTAADLCRCQSQAARRLRLRRDRSGRRDRPGHHRRRPVDDADRRTRRARHEAAELLRHPHRPDARQSGAA